MKVVLHHQDLRMATNLLPSQQIAFLLKSSYKHFERRVGRKKKKSASIRSFMCTCWLPRFFSSKCTRCDTSRIVVVNKEAIITDWSQRQVLNRSQAVVNSTGTNLNIALSLCDRALFTGEDGDIWLVLLVLSSYSHMETGTLRGSTILMTTRAGWENSSSISVYRFWFRVC